MAHCLYFFGKGMILSTPVIAIQLAFPVEGPVSLRSIVPVKGSVPKARYRTSAVACAVGVPGDGIRITNLGLLRWSKLQRSAVLFPVLDPAWCLLPNVSIDYA